MEKTSGDVWMHASNLHEGLLKSLKPGGGEQTAGDFTYALFKRGYIQYSFGNVQAGVRCPRASERIFRIERDGSERLLASTSIEERKPVVGYPLFIYKWSDRGGKLTTLTLHKADNATIQYKRDGSEPVRCGKSALLKDLPGSIDGETEILGVPIPWTIDYNQMGWEIVNGMRLEDFAAAVKKAR